MAGKNGRKVFRGDWSGRLQLQGWNLASCFSKEVHYGHADHNGVGLFHLPLCECLSLSPKVEF